MAKKKATSRGRPREKPRKRSWLGRFFRIVFLWLLPPLVAAALLVIFWDEITAWIGDTALFIWALFGWGLVICLAALGTLIGLFCTCRFAALCRRWNRFLGAIAFLAALWGMLALFSGAGVLRQVGLGGYIGLGIIGALNLAGILRIIGLVVLGIVLIIPRRFFRAIGRFFVWLWHRMEIRVPAVKARKPKPSPPVAEAPAFRKVGPVPEPQRIPLEGEEAVPSLLEPDQPQPDLRQVAQEVWKKYGESGAAVVVDGWRLPPIEILDLTAETEFSQADNMQRARLIEDALSSYGVEGKVVQINVGPTVTQFGIEPGWDRRTKEVKERDRDGNVTIRQEEVSRTRVKVDRITSLSSDLALALAAPSIRIEAPVPGKSIVGIEVPNTVFSMVSLRGVVETSVFQKTIAKSNMALALGKGAGGEAAAGDLTKMPHLLIAGATGSGKTVCLNSTICCLLLHNTPFDMRFIMIDPKRVELTPYNSIPHLATPVIVDTERALSTLRWLSQEMDKRYQVMAAARVRNIEGYNRTRQGAEKLPYLVLVIDELADLMMTAGDEVEHMLCRLAQLARATGIHLIVATQRPSVDVITGLIKANFPTRISFAVTSQVDSRTILDGAGAEKLLGRGDMLYMPTEAAKPRRLQGCYVSEVETERLVYFWNSQQPEVAVQLKLAELIPPTAGERREEYPEDPLMNAARRLAEEHKHVSTSFLQRRLHIGYPRAARLMDQLQEEMEQEEGEGEGE